MYVLRTKYVGSLKLGATGLKSLQYDLFMRTTMSIYPRVICRVLLGILMTAAHDANGYKRDGILAHVL